MNRKSETDRKVYVPLRLRPNDVAYLDVLAAGNRTKAVELCIETTRTIEEQLNEPEKAK